MPLPNPPNGAYTTGYPPGFNPAPTVDPTTATKAAVDAATDQWRRDLLALEQILETRFDAIDQATTLRIEQFPKQWGEQIIALKELHGEKFDAINVRFLERDVRTEQGAEASQKALDAALLAAAALVAQQNEANSRAADIVVANTTKQIDTILEAIRAAQAANDQKFADLKERIDRGEGSTVGSEMVRTETRGQNNWAISAALALTAIIVSVGVALFLHRTPTPTVPAISCTVAAAGEQCVK